VRTRLDVKIHWILTNTKQKQLDYIPGRKKVRRMEVGRTKAERREIKKNDEILATKAQRHKGYFLLMRRITNPEVN